MDAESRERKAVALGYDSEGEAPRIIASGKGKLAEKIIAEAGAEGIPVHRDDSLVESLSHLDIDEYIPPDLYGVVVDVLDYVGRIDAVRAKVEAGDRAKTAAADRKS